MTHHHYYHDHNFQKPCYMSPCYYNCTNNKIDNSDKYKSSKIMSVGENSNGNIEVKEMCQNIRKIYINSQSSMMNTCNERVPVLHVPQNCQRNYKREKSSKLNWIRLCLLTYVLNIIYAIDSINAIYAINSGSSLQQIQGSTLGQRYAFSVSRSLSKSGQPFVDERAANNSVVAAVVLIDSDQNSSGNEKINSQLINSENGNAQQIQQNLSSNGNLPTTIAIEKGNELNHFTLALSRSTYIIKVNGPLDKHKIPQYNLTIVARQNYSSTILATTNLVIKVNNCSPKFTMPQAPQSQGLTQSQNQNYQPVGYFHLPLVDSLQANAKILTVSATDCDDDDILVYKITSCDDELLSPDQSQDNVFECPIKIDDATGELRTATMIDKDRTLKISIFIEVRDGAGFKDTMHVVLSKSPIPLLNGSLTMADAPPSPFGGPSSQDPTVYGVAIVMAFLMSIMLIISICLVRIRCMMGKPTSSSSTYLNHDHHPHHAPHNHHHHHAHHLHNNHSNNGMTASNSSQNMHSHHHHGHHSHTHNTHGLYNGHTHNGHHGHHHHGHHGHNHHGHNEQDRISASISQASHVNSSMHHGNPSMQSLRHHDWSLHHVNSIHHARSVSSPNPHLHPYQQQPPPPPPTQPPYYEQQPNGQLA